MHQRVGGRYIEAARKKKYDGATKNKKVDMKAGSRARCSARQSFYSPLRGFLCPTQSWQLCIETALQKSA